MKPLTEEWVIKAEGDFSTAGRELRARTAPNYDAVCFHAQQCVEKYLKAVLQEEEIEFGKTHNLSALLDKIIASYPRAKAPTRLWQGRLISFARMSDRQSGYYLAWTRNNTNKSRHI